MRMLRAVAGQPWTRVVVMATICCSSALFACLASAGDAPRVMLRAGTAASCDQDVSKAVPEADAKHAIPRPARFASLPCCVPIRAHVHAVGGAGGAGVSNALLALLCSGSNESEICACRTGLALRSTVDKDCAGSVPPSLRSGWALKGAGRSRAAHMHDLVLIYACVQECDSKA